MFTPAALLLARADGNLDSALFKPASLGANDPFAQGRKVAHAGADGVTAGIVQTSGHFSSDDFPHDEMIVVHAGQLVLRSGDQVLELSPGASAVIGRGTSLQIEAHANTLWAFCAVSSEAPEANPGLTLLDPREMLSPSSPPEPQILIGPTPQCRSGNVFHNPKTDLRIGTWDSTPYIRYGRPHKLNELMHLVEGSVTLEATDGSRVTVNTGDTVFVPFGAPCAWQSTVYVRKFYVVK